MSQSTCGRQRTTLWTMFLLSTFIYASSRDGTQVASLAQQAPFPAKPSFWLHIDFVCLFIWSAGWCSEIESYPVVLPGLELAT